MSIESGKPLVSLIVFCYNQPHFVRETLESVRAQTYKNTELIIIDDCSTDDSVAIIEGWLQETGTKCTFIRHEKNQGICKTVNDAVTRATGKYISMIASDDLWLPEKTERQVEIMESQPEDVAVLYSDALQIDESGRPLPVMFVESWKSSLVLQGRILDSLVLGCFVLPQTSLIRRSCYDKVGFYDENLRFEDWDMWLRIARHYSFAYSPTPFAKYRIHENSYSRSDPPRVIKGWCDVALKQLRLGDLTEHQKSVLTQNVVTWATQLYERHNEPASDILFALWQATGNKRAGWMYRLARFGVSYHAVSVWDKISWTVRNYVWYPILNATRPLRHPLGLSRAKVRCRPKEL